MKIPAIVLIAFFITTAATFAQDAAKGDLKKAKSEEISQKICPVTGENADPEVSYAYNGKTYYFCCNGCVKKFKADPAKYIKASEAKKFDACTDHAAAAKIDDSKPVINTGKDMSAKIVNTTCPVMGEEVDKAVTTVSYKGNVYGFCCKACIKKFAANPDKYLKNKMN
jgi:P-type Cu+ transporter